MGCYDSFCPFQEARLFLTEEEIQRGIEKRDLDEIRKQYIRGNSYNVIDMYKYDCLKLYKTDNIVKQHLRESFPNKMPLKEKMFFENMKNRSMVMFNVLLKYPRLSG